ncbi:MAG TPA: hypothetical protein PKE45_12990, partial [Caldilineaceae bacterium]|nr:hypothetical protein [Caldilineaceae bacterium]
MNRQLTRPYRICSVLIILCQIFAITVAGTVAAIQPTPQLAQEAASTLGLPGWLAGSVAGQAAQLFGAPHTALAQATSPGGVNTNLLAWYKADAGVEKSGGAATEGGLVDVWRDQGGNSNDATQGAPANQPTFRANRANFNPAIEAPLGPQVLNTPLNINAGIHPALSVLAVYRPTDLNNDNQSGAVWGEDDGGFDRFINDVNFDGCLSSVTTGSGCSSVPNLYVENVWSLSSVVFAEDVANGSAVYVNGLSEHIFTSDHAPETSNPLSILNDGDDSFYQGDVTEVIVYNSLLTTANQRQRIESYLAVKYGLTLGNTTTPVNYLDSGSTTVWTGSATYQNDVAGIGRDDAAALSQKQSKSVNSGALVTVGLGTIAADNASNPNTFAADKSFLVWGND